MALFGSNSQQVTGNNVTQPVIEQTENSFDFLASGMGNDVSSISQDMVGQAYLGIIQSGSDYTEVGNVGEFIDTGLRESLGNEVKVYVLDVKSVWVERDPEPPYGTIGRYAPGSIEVTKTMKNGRLEMTNPSTGNKIQELFMYAVVYKDRPELGVRIFSPTSGSMRACRSWNTMLRSQFLPNGQRAVKLFSYAWTLKTGLFLPKGQKDTESNYKASLISVTRDELLSKDLFMSLQPQIAASSDLQMIPAPEAEEE